MMETSAATSGPSRSSRAHRGAAGAGVGGASLWRDRIRYRRDPLVLCMLLPQVMAIAGYAFSGRAGQLLLSLADACGCPHSSDGSNGALRAVKPESAVGIVVCVAALAIVPARIRLADTLHRMPSMVRSSGSRTIAGRGQPMRARSRRNSIAEDGRS